MNGAWPAVYASSSATTPHPGKTISDNDNVDRVATNEQTLHRPISSNVTRIESQLVSEGRRPSGQNMEVPSGDEPLLDSHGGTMLNQTKAVPAAQEAHTAFPATSSSRNEGILDQLGIPGSARAIEQEREAPTHPSLLLPLSEWTADDSNLTPSLDDIHRRDGEPVHVSLDTQSWPSSPGLLNESPAQNRAFQDGSGIVREVTTENLTDDGWGENHQSDFITSDDVPFQEIPASFSGETNVISNDADRDSTAIQDPLASHLEAAEAATTAQDMIRPSEPSNSFEAPPSVDNAHVPSFTGPEASFFDESHTQTGSGDDWDKTYASVEVMVNSSATQTIQSTLDAHPQLPSEADSPTARNANNQFTETHDPFADNDKAGADWLSEEKPGEEIEDSWAKALGSPEAGVDTSWEAAFGEELDDEGFLDDLSNGTTTQTTLGAGKTSYVPQSTASAAITATPNAWEAPRSSPYGVGQPIRSAVSTQQPSTPMKFFEELPVTQPIKTRRPKQPVVSHSSSPAPPPTAPPVQPGPPARQPSHSPYAQFRPPERLDPFPAQTISAQVANLTHHQPPPQTNMSSRYSPAPAPPSAPPSTQHAAPHQSTAQPPTAPNLPPGPGRYSPSTGHLSKQSYAVQPPQPVRSSPYDASQPLATLAELPRPTGPGDARTMAADRYSPVSSAALPAPPPPNRFAPRTSSPLAQPEHRPQSNRSVTAPASQYDELDTLMQPPTRSNLTRASVPPESSSTQRPNSGHSQFTPFTPSSVSNSSAPLRAQQYSPPASQTSRIGESLPGSPSKASLASQYAPHAHSDTTQVMPPFRTRSSSPSLSRHAVPAPKPASERSFPTQGNRDHPYGEIASQAPIQSNPETEETNFVIPENENALDPLKRWKGHAIFHWGPGGLVSTSFPKRIPRYAGGQSAPTLKCLPGEVKLVKVKDAYPVDEILTSFPGPLKSKNKKKDVISWLSRKIDALQLELQDRPIDAPNDHSGQSRMEEKVVLWELVRLLVEHDGILAGTPAVDSAVKWIVSPNLQAIATQKLNDERGSSRASGAGHASNAADGVDANIVEALRANLLRGEREQAVWQAVDSRHWAHAFLISSTMANNVWKQVVQEFVRKEVRTSGPENQSLAALYQVFAGNWDESVDELVPVSARAGLQMMSTSEARDHGNNMLEGLNRWRETLGLMLSNRSSDDEKAMVALGNLLVGYNRIEAAHVCFLFSRTVSSCGGADDSNSHFTLLGANPNHSPETSQDLDAILLTEVYEFALSLSPTASAFYMPHLQAYKLHHAYILAESGQRAEALQYCDAIAAAVKATTRPSPYYHPTLISQTNDLAQRLAQSSKISGSSWIAKPFSSGSMWAKFNSFVAGDDTDAASTGSGSQMEPESGPFAHMAGGSPSVSRSESTGDLYGAHMTGVPSGAINSRYAPAVHAPKQFDAPHHSYGGSPFQQPAERMNSPYEPRQSLESYSSSYGSSPSANYMQRQPSNLSQSQSYEPAIRGSYQPRSSPPRNFYASNIDEVHPVGETPIHDPIEEDRSFGFPSVPVNGGMEEPGAGEKSNGFGTAPNGYTSYSSGYQPTSGGYEPPTGSSYQPYEPDTSADLDVRDEKPKKASFMDDDDDDDDALSRRAAELKKEDRAKSHREPDDAVRRAAEADAARDKAAAADKRGGWFGGWFGKKDPNAPVVHKAKLGEESSFYFDPDTKKWVNKKAGATAPTAAAPTPPPPKGPPSGPPSRSVSGANITSFGSAGPPLRAPPMTSSPAPPVSVEAATATLGPPSGPPSRVATPARTASPAESTGMEGATATTLGESGIPSGPPSRPPTSMSNASSIDDLLGVPAARKGGTIKKGKKTARYVDVMGK